LKLWSAHPVVRVKNLQLETKELTYTGNYMKKQILFLAAISALGAIAQTNLHASASSGAGAGKIGTQSGTIKVARAPRHH